MTIKSICVLTGDYPEGHYEIKDTDVNEICFYEKPSMANKCNHTDSDEEEEEEPEPEPSMTNKCIHTSSDEEEEEDQNIIESKLLIELENDFYISSQIIEGQMKTRDLMFKKILKSYIKPYSTVKKIPFTQSVIENINKIGNKLGLKDKICSIIAELLFDYNICIFNQIEKYKPIFLLFLDTAESKNNFLNQIIYFFNNLVEKNQKQNIFKYNMTYFSEIFKKLLDLGVISKDDLIFWYPNSHCDSMAVYYMFASDLKEYGIGLPLSKYV